MFVFKYSMIIIIRGYVRPVFTIEFIAACLQVDLLDICHCVLIVRLLDIIVFLMSQLILL